MIVSTHYSMPLKVNGYRCTNCTDVDYAKKNIDPQHPQSGPYNINAAHDPSRRGELNAQGQTLSPTGNLVDTRT